MENIFRKRVRAVVKNTATHDNQVVYGYYTIDINGYITITVFANTRSYSYKTGVHHRGYVTAKVVNTVKYNDKKYIVNIKVAVNRYIDDFVTAATIFGQALLAIGYCSDID